MRIRLFHYENKEEAIKHRDFTLLQKVWDREMTPEEVEQETRDTNGFISKHPNSSLDPSNPGLVMDVILFEDKIFGYSEFQQMHPEENAVEFLRLAEVMEV